VHLRYPSPAVSGAGGVAGLLQAPCVVPGIKYAISWDLQIPYQVVGGWAVDIALAFDWGSNMELVWEHPPLG
jgi:hypothetical protein